MQTITACSIREVILLMSAYEEWLVGGERKRVGTENSILFSSSLFFF